MGQIFCYTIKYLLFAIPKGPTIYHTKWDQRFCYTIMFLQFAIPKTDQPSIIPNGINLLLYHKVPTICHTKTDKPSIIPNGTNLLLYHNVPTICHTKTDQPSIIPNGTKLLPYHKVPTICHTKKTYHLSYQMGPTFCYTIMFLQFAILKQTSLLYLIRSLLNIYLLVHC